ncbi:uncharacterized protein N7503_010773 [Penicillium pulvis]|uniref:uncharacterized protein n=1 Tax=Penicillium pulvis TaxID=1562058 RepID=UPI0025474720|nr:uncharacterized protein N7503_010773 [Penicillium pulvis]KAJ5785561.1 hypothetical protein N7503_010773 [Penicillium pulvis]
MANSKSNPAPVVLPPNYTSIKPSESFASPDYGIVTWHTLFSAPNTNTSDMSAGIAACPPRSGHLCPHRHKQAEIYYVIEGQGKVAINGVESTVSKGSTVFIPGDAEHGIVNTGEKELKWFYVFPTGSFEDVIYRFSKDENVRKETAKL